MTRTLSQYCAFADKWLYERKVLCFLDDISGDIYQLVITQCIFICRKLFIELHRRISDPFQQNPTELLHCLEVRHPYLYLKGKRQSKTVFCWT